MRVEPHPWRTSLVLAALPFALACVAGGCDRGDPGCYDRSADHVRIGMSSTGVDVPPDGVVLSGSFAQWGPGEVLFSVDDGSSVGFTLELEKDASLPDLSSDAVGQVTLVGWGFEGVSSRPTEPTIEVYTAGDSLLFILGTSDWSIDGSSWAVQAPRDMDSCTAYVHNQGQARNKAVYISFDDETARLFQGDTTTLGGMEVRVLSAQSNNRSHPWAPCATADCPWEKLSWIAISPSLDLSIESLEDETEG